MHQDARSPWKATVLFFSWAFQIYETRKQIDALDKTQTRHVLYVGDKSGPGESIHMAASLKYKPVQSIVKTSTVGYCDPKHSSILQYSGNFSEYLLIVFKMFKRMMTNNGIYRPISQWNMLGIGADVADAGAPATWIDVYVDGHNTALIELVMKAPAPAAQIKHNLRSI